MWALTSAPTSRWVSIKSDSTGQYLAAVQGYNSESGSGIYVSTSYGSEWSLTSAPLATTNNQWRWSSVAMVLANILLLLKKMEGYTHLLMVSNNYNKMIVVVLVVVVDVVVVVVVAM